MFIVKPNNETFRIPRENTPKEIDLGCGTRKRAFGIDLKLPADLIYDLRDGIPFEPDTIDIIYAYDFLEHLSDPIFIMKEIWRVLIDGGKLDFMVPSTDGKGAFQDPRHRSYWNINSIDYWISDNSLADDIRGPCLFKTKCESILPATIPGDITRGINYVKGNLFAVKTVEWLNTYRLRNPQDFIWI